MPKFAVFSKEINYYIRVVEADSELDAMGEISDIDDAGEYINKEFEIFSAELLEETEDA